MDKEICIKNYEGYPLYVSEVDYGIRKAIRFTLLEPVEKEELVAVEIDGKNATLILLVKVNNEHRFEVFKINTPTLLREALKYLFFCNIEQIKKRYQHWIDP